MLVQRCALEQHRLILPVSVSKPAFRDGSFISHFSQQHQFRALVDTGAQRSVIARWVITDLDLIRIGHMEFAGLHGPRTHSRYLAAIGLWARRIEPNSSSHEFERSELSLFALDSPYDVVDMDDNSNFDLILGFDVLKQFSFNFDPTNRIFELQVKP